MRPYFPSVVQWTAAGCGLPRVTDDVGRPSSDLLYQFHRLVVPSAPVSMANGKKMWVLDSWLYLVYLLLLILLLLLLLLLL